MTTVCGGFMYAKAAVLFAKCAVSKKSRMKKNTRHLHIANVLVVKVPSNHVFIALINHQS